MFFCEPIQILFSESVRLNPGLRNGLCPRVHQLLLTTPSSFLLKNIVPILKSLLMGLLKNRRDFVRREWSETLQENRESISRKIRASMPPGSSVSQYFVYILECRDGKLYTGFTSDPERRLRQHQGGRASKYTRSRLPVRLVFLERCPSRSASLRREAVIKRMTRGEKLRLCASPPVLRGNAREKR